MLAVADTVGQVMVGCESALWVILDEILIAPDRDAHRVM
jgi:hypothetical protein